MGVSLPLKPGRLQNVDLEFGAIPDDSGPPLTNQNSVIPGVTLQFMPWGLYSDGVSRALLSSNFAGSSGIWTSSNPAVMYVTQTGLAYALSWGTATISHISPKGVHFSPWVMTVVQPIGDCC
jgi:hypothetical protein